MTGLGQLAAALVLLPCFAILVRWSLAGALVVQAAAVAVFAVAGAIAGQDPGLGAAAVIVLVKAVLVARGAVGLRVPPMPPISGVAAVATLLLVLVAAVAVRPLGSGIADVFGAALATVLVGVLIALHAPLPGLAAAENGLALALCAVPDFAARPLLLLAAALPVAWAFRRRAVRMAA